MNLPEPETTNPSILGELTSKVIQFWGASHTLLTYFHLAQSWRMDRFLIRLFIPASHPTGTSNACGTGA